MSRHLERKKMNMRELLGILYSNPRKADSHLSNWSLKEGRKNGAEKYLKI